MGIKLYGFGEVVEPPQQRCVPFSIDTRAASIGEVYMTTIMPIEEPRPRGTVIGEQVAGPHQSEAKHSWKYARSGMA
jgi:hypothetical protein